MPVKIFCCYAHEDEALLDQLKKHLRPLQRQGLINVWHDRDIIAGTEWEQEISEQFESAQIILLLVSPDFMNSDYCYSIEMKRAMERHERGEASVIPIILRHVYWQGSPFGKLQALPKDGLPVTSHDWHNIDKALFNVIEGIHKVVEEVTTKPSISPSNKEFASETEYAQQIVQFQREPVTSQFMQHLSDNAQVGMAGVNYGPVTIHQTPYQEGINKEDFAKFRDEIDRKHQAQILFLKAENTISLVECEQFIYEALQKYPDLPGARSFLGLRMSGVVQAHFSSLLHPSNNMVELGSLGEAVTPMFRAHSALLSSAPPKLEAIRWLEEALQYKDDPDGNVIASLALMYGYNEEYDKMIDTLQKALTINPSLITYFQRPNNLMMLIYACHDLASIKEVMRNVNLNLPQIDEVQQAIKEAIRGTPPSYIRVSPVKWYAIEMKMGDISRMPAEVLIAIPGNDGLTYAQITKKGQLTITIPPEASMIIETKTLIPIDEILKRLTEKGFVLITLI